MWELRPESSLTRSGAETADCFSALPPSCAGPAGLTVLSSAGRPHPATSSPSGRTDLENGVDSLRSLREPQHPQTVTHRHAHSFACSFFFSVFWWRNHCLTSSLLIQYLWMVLCALCAGVWHTFSYKKQPHFLWLAPFYPCFISVFPVLRGYCSVLLFPVSFSPLTFSCSPGVSFTHPSVFSFVFISLSVFASCSCSSLVSNVPLFVFCLALGFCY